MKRKLPPSPVYLCRSCARVCRVRPLCALCDPEASLGDRLWFARRQSRFREDEAGAARLADIDPLRLSKQEWQTQRLLTADELTRLADIYGVPSATLGV